MWAWSGPNQCPYRSQWARARFDYNDTDPRVTVRPAVSSPSQRRSRRDIGKLLPSNSDSVADSLLSS
jgi:hypothetical protein